MVVEGQCIAVVSMMSAETAERFAEKSEKRTNSKLK